MAQAVDCEILTLRLLLAHWPDDCYILRGFASAWGEDAIDEVAQCLSKRRLELEKELAKRQGGRIAQRA